MSNLVINALTIIKGVIRAPGYQVQMVMISHSAVEVEHTQWLKELTVDQRVMERLDEGSVEKVAIADRLLKGCDYFHGGFRAS
jgi:hypothetical protein